MNANDKDTFARLVNEAKLIRENLLHSNRPAADAIGEVLAEARYLGEVDFGKLRLAIIEGNDALPSETAEDEYHDALILMERIGGGFASSLALAWLKADLRNRRKLDSAFGSLLEEYIKLVKESKPNQATA